MIFNIFEKTKIRYLIAGVWNTIFGYFIMIFLYKLNAESLGIILIAVISNLISITMSFLTYKIFVFRTRGSWFAEWTRSFIVYGVAAIFSTMLIWLLVDLLQVNIYLSQAIAISFIVLLSYIGHNKFTFKIK